MAKPDFDSLAPFRAKYQAAKHAFEQKLSALYPHGAKVTFEAFSKRREVGKGTVIGWRIFNGFAFLVVRRSNGKEHEVLCSNVTDVRV